MRYFLLVAAALLTTACQERKSSLDINSAKLRSNLALSAFECSHVAPNPAEASRLFNLGVLAGRDFLEFATGNQSGFKSIASQIDPVWTRNGNRPSADFHLGEIHAASVGRAYADRGRMDDRDWEVRRNEIYAQRNCPFLRSETKAK